MDQLILKALNTQLTRENELLRIQVLQLTERFNIIVNWVNNQFYELWGVPDEVVVAIRGKPDIILVIPRSDDEETPPRRGIQNSLTQHSVRNKNQPLAYNPFVALDTLEKLTLHNTLQSLAALNKITNHDAIVGPQSELNRTDNSSLTCTICSRSFNLNIQLKKHKRMHLMKKISKPERQGRKASNSEMTNSIPLTTIENRFVKFEMHSESSSDSDMSPLFDPLDDSEKHDTIRNAPCSLSESSLTDKIEIKVETPEDSQNISIDEKANPLSRTHSKQTGNQKYHYHGKNNIKPPRPYIKRGKLPEDGLKCKVCGKEFPMFCRLRAHEQRYHVTSNGVTKNPQNHSHLKINRKPPRPYIKRAKLPEDGLKCNECGKEFPMFCRLRAHEEKCQVPSEAVIETNSEIEGVKKIQTTYKCLKCETLFTLKKEYFSHQKKCKPGNKTKDQKVPALCEMCGKGFVSHYCLNLHMRFVHKGEKNFLCTECGKSFSRLDTLVSHEKCHTGTRNYKCDYCDKTFIRRQSKYIHEKWHLGTLKTNCPICGKEFASRPKMLRHVQCIHENRRKYKCPLCEKSFKQKNSLNYHLNTHNNPNGRKRGLNKDIDHMKAAEKRRHCNRKNDTSNFENLNTINPNKTIFSLAAENISTQ